MTDLSIPDIVVVGQDESLLRGKLMRLSTDRYPEYVDFECTNEGCWYQNYSVRVDSIEVDDVRVYCESCGSPTYVRVIF